MEIPTNVEMIVQEGMKNKVLVGIPGTKFAILGTKTKNGNFNADIISKIGCKKARIGENISEYKMAAIIAKTLVFREVGHFKNHPTKMILTKFYKQIIND